MASRTGTIPWVGGGVRYVQVDYDDPPQPPAAPPIQTVMADPGERDCPFCLTVGSYQYQGLGYWYCGVCDHGDYDDELDERDDEERYPDQYAGMDIEG